MELNLQPHRIAIPVVAVFGDGNNSVRTFSYFYGLVLTFYAFALRSRQNLKLQTTVFVQSK